MTTVFDLRTMALLLQQGARADALSRGALLVASAWLVASIVLSRLPGAVVGSVLLASVVAGLVQAYYALRVGFDAALLDALANTLATPETASSARETRALDAEVLLDDSLQSLGLLPASKAGRDWPARWAGASRLLRLQGVWLALQLVGLLVAVAIAL